MKYPFEKHKLDRARIIKAYDIICSEIDDKLQTKSYLLAEIKKFSQVNSGKK